VYYLDNCFVIFVSDLDVGVSCTPHSISVMLF
jgi:hypothetical protein